MKSERQTTIHPIIYLGQKPKCLLCPEKVNHYRKLCDYHGNQKALLEMIK